jgi:hypothetical protein
VFNVSHYVHCLLFTEFFFFKDKELFLNNTPMIFSKINDHVICFIGSKMKWYITTYILRAALFSLYDIFTLSNTNYRKRNINGEQQRLIQYTTYWRNYKFSVRQG